MRNTTNTNKTTTLRLNTIDEIRGLTIISMVAFHACWDIVYLLHQNWTWYSGTGAYIWQQSICWSFILISGFCFSMGKHKLKRGLITFCAGIIITLATLIFEPDEKIIFGVLTCIGSCMLLMLPLERFFAKINPTLGLILAMFLFFITRGVNEGYLGFEGIELYSLPNEIYSNYFTTYLGFPFASFFSTDYFSVFPWLFLYITGYFLYRMFAPTKIMNHLLPMRIKGLAFIGRHSLLIYMIHQVVLYGIVMLILMAK